MFNTLNLYGVREGANFDMFDSQIVVEKVKIYMFLFSACLDLYVESNWYVTEILV